MAKVSSLKPIDTLTTCSTNTPHFKAELKALLMSTLTYLLHLCGLRK